jgi:phosphopantothenoylcysteine synthetase/decarboxylase
VGNLCTFVVCGAPLAVRAPDMATALVEAGWRVQVIATPAAAEWVDMGVVDEVTGRAARNRMRAPDQPKNRERASVVVVAPMTFNTIGKLAGGIADTLAHSALCEALGEGIPFIAVPMVNQFLRGHPAFAANVELLTAAGVTWVSLVDGAAGEFEPVQSGTGEQLTKTFDPYWLSRHLPIPERPE